MKKADSCISIVGMPTSGKTTLGSQLATALNREFADSDQLFEAAMGTTIPDFVAQYGWESFRKHEEEIIEHAIKPGLVLALGGGAIESASTQKHLLVQTRVIWIRAELQTILERWCRQQKGAERPQLTKLSIEQETMEKLVRRTPLFERVSEIIVNAEDSVEQQITHIRKKFGFSDGAAHRD